MQDIDFTVQQRSFLQPIESVSNLADMAILPASSEWQGRVRTLFVPSYILRALTVAGNAIAQMIPDPIGLRSNASAMILPPSLARTAAGMEPASRRIADTD
ncbi:hypothetical protein C9E81_20275 [Paracoccus alkanivorans]|uniref:Uncharacterized protein n=1 Tax=Paracoccus alkanivorans TaxID=2116655 RepID=A0A3M0M7W7_9RHOB|nr:hypothetical protein C9E81_20275 [Paracoccus alkanivorans]